MVKSGVGMSERSPSESRSSEAKYRGVRKRKWGKWVSEIRLPNSRERIWLGSYDSPEKAARAFDAALFCLRGNTANFNFPHQPPNIPGATHLHPSEIQAVAARFANSSQLQTPDHSPSVSYHTSTTSIDVDTSSFLPPAMAMDDINIHTSTSTSVPDFGIFPGFDDYFLPHPPPLAADNLDYGEEVCDGIYSQDPSFLWSF